MDARQAARTLEVIRSLMERTCQYQLLTARAGLAAGCLAGLGSLLFLFLDPAKRVDFVAVWSLVFVGSLLATLMGTVMRGRERGERVWSRQARAVLLNLAPSLFAALALSRRNQEHDPDIATDAARYFEMAERYRQAAIATFRAHRDRGGAS